MLALAVAAQTLADDPLAPPKPAPPPAPASALKLETPPAAPAEETAGAGRAGANLLGQTDTAKGEARRNENVQINLVDTNAARELNVRVGATATIIEEFRPDRGYFSAEYGNAARPAPHAQAQSGAGLHGNVFWSHNNSVFSARSFFQAGPVQPARQNQYGGQVGVPPWKRAFLQASGSRDNHQGNVNGNVLIPLPEERIPLATDPAARAAVERLIGAYPDVPPNRPDVAARALNANSLQLIKTDTAAGQLTQKPGDRDAAIFRYSFTGQRVDAFQFTKGQNPDTANKNHAARATWNRTWSPFTITDVSMGFDRQGSLLLPARDAVGPVYLNGLQMLGPHSSIPLDRAINQFRYNVSVQHRRGAHAYTAGAGVVRQQYTGEEPDGARPAWQFRDDFGRDMITNLRLGTPSNVSQMFGNVYRAFRNWEWQVFAGDRWALHNRLTLNYGVRWEPWTRPVDAAGLSNLPFGSDWNNAGGHFGFAYRLPAGVVHGGFAAMHGQLFPATYGQDRINAPHVINISVQAPDIANPFQNLTPADFSPTGRSSRYEISPDLAAPYSYQYNLSWENQLAGGWKLQVGYVGSRSHKLYQTYNLNRARPVDGIPFTTATINQRRPDQSLFSRFYTLNGSRAYYDAGRVTLLVPRWRGATVSASYWLSKAIDQGSDYTVTGGGQEKWGQAGQNEAGVQRDQRGLSNFDQPHALLLQAAWDTGRGGRGPRARWYRNWNITTVFLLKSGTPFTVDSGSDGPGFGNVDGANGDRPNVVDPAVLGRIVGDPDTSEALLPRSAFAFIRAPQQMAGNLARNTFRKGKIANTNAAISRTWALAAEWTMTLRAEAINLTNTPQFAEPGRSLTSPNFGQITNTLNDGRTFRFLLRLGF